MHAKSALVSNALPDQPPMSSLNLLIVLQESELLCLLSDWVCHCASERQHHLSQLLPLLKLSALPEERLSRQQLQACSGAHAVTLAQQLYRAAQACQHAQPALHQQRQWQQPQLQHANQQQAGSRRQAGPATADFSVTGQCLWGSSSRTAAENMCGVHRRGSDDANNCIVSSSHDVQHARSNNAAAPDGVIEAFAGSSSTTSMHNICEVLSVYEPEQIGAVVAQAWPGRQRGYQATSILVAGMSSSDLVLRTLQWNKQLRLCFMS